MNESDDSGYAVGLGAAMEVAGEVPWEFHWLLLLAIPALLALNAFFVAAEFSLVAVRRTQIEEMLRRGLRGARSLKKQVQHLDHAIAATQLGITLASIGLGFVGEPALARLLLPLFQFLPGPWDFLARHSVAIAIAFAVITFLHVILGELAPKAVALQRPAQVALWVAVPLEVFTFVTRPLVRVTNGLGNWVVQRLGFRSLSGAERLHSVEEILMLVDQIEEAGLLSPDQAEYVQNVFRLSTKRVADCMVPRDKMAALELQTPPEKVLEIVRLGAHTRLPVYDGDLDNIVGLVNTKDLFYLFSLRGVVVLQDALYPPLFLKPEQPIADALRLFKKSHRPMAIVRDDAGKTLGLLTLEDVLEEIVGDIEDEHDRQVAKLRLPSHVLAKLRAMARGDKPAGDDGAGGRA
jgi:CBS domain containing-hemolysin-like protein